LYFRKNSDGSYPDTIESFSTESTGYCGADLGEKEPENYPGDYGVDKKYPSVDRKTGKNITR
jgi:hypothetical protein